MSARHNHLMRAGVGLALGAAFLALTSCAHPLRRFPMAEPMLTDTEDFRFYGPRPEEYFSPFAWDGADQMLFRPISRVFAVEQQNEAINVNAMDEVPNSSWFENRLGRRDMTPEEFALAACPGPVLDEDAPAGSWPVVGGKANGANPGFTIEGPDGTRYLLKFDPLDQPERATTADVFGSIVYWAAGYYSPCNRIVYFDPSILRIGEGATTEVDGEEVPMTMEMIAPALARAPRDERGRLRASASRFVDGRPIGPWRYEGLREDDPNDVVPHQERRELRGAYVLAAWLNHFDSREQNTLAVWMTPEDAPEGTGYVRHYYIDWGDCLGSRWAIDGIWRRLGHSGYFDLGHFLADFVTLGTIPRPWHRAEIGPGGETLGLYQVRDFVPDRYRPGYPNPAFNRSTERDQAWMARLMARMTPAMIDAAIDEGRMQNQEVRAALFEILLGRRELILERWLTRLSPLSRPELARNAAGDARVCFQDLAVTSGLVDFDARPYWSRAYRHVRDAEVEALPRPALVRRGADQICAALPSRADASPESPAYLIVDVAGVDLDDEGQPEDDARPVRAHLYQTGPGDYRLVGLERPDHLRVPGGRD